MPLFPESFLQEVADRNDIVDVVSSYVKLTKRSGANLFGLCPFHSEKTPSFSVAPDKQIYHCFGCGKGGSVINFIMEIENLSFPDAVAFLANRAGLALPENGSDGERRRRERMLSLNRDAARFFYSQLVAPSGAAGREYLAGRGISAKMTTAFGLGYAPNSWNALTGAMKSKGYTEQELFDAGLVRHGKSGGVYDTFHSRLMFPVIDVRGAVIGFSGRIIGEGEPKYMNSPETMVFSKSHNLFALNLAKKSKRGYIILAEGNIDVVSLHQAGFDCAVASLGTSLTPEQARLLSRYTSEVVIAYDNDGAGQKASQRAIGILEKLDLKVRVLRMEGAKDPDEFIKTRGADAFSLLLEKSENHVEYRLRSIAAKYTLDTPEQKVAYLREAAAAVAELSSAVERQVYAMRLAEQVGVDKSVVIDEVERSRAARLKSAKREAEKAAVRTGSRGRARDRSIRYENERSAMAEEGVIRLLYLDPELVNKVSLMPEDFTSPLLGRFYTAVREKALAHAPLSMAALGGEFTGAEISHLTSILQQPENLANARIAMRDYIATIKEEKYSAAAGDDPLAFAEQMRNKKGYGG